MQAVSEPKSVLKFFIESVFDPNTADFWLQKFNPIWSVNQSLGKVLEKKQLANDTVALTIQTNKNFVPALAGQHHPVVILHDGRRYERTYSLTQVSSDQVLLTAKKVDKGVVSTWLNDQAQVGDIIEFGQPYGEMTLNQEEDSLLLIAAGSGITPMYSLIKEYIKVQNNKRQVQLMYWVKTRADAAFLNEFESIAKSHSNFKLDVFYTQEGGQRLNDEHLKLVQSLAQSTVYICGPSGFVTTAEALFKSARILKSEAFSLSPVLSDEIGSIQITLSKSKKIVTIPKGQSILVGLEQQNIKPTHGCRMGICNKCACNKAQGSTKNLVNGAENNEPGNLLKICVNSAQTDLVIDL